MKKAIICTLASSVPFHPNLNPLVPYSFHWVECHIFLLLLLLFLFFLNQAYCAHQSIFYSVRKEGWCFYWLLFFLSIICQQMLDFTVTEINTGCCSVPKSLSEDCKNTCPHIWVLIHSRRLVLSGQRVAGNDQLLWTKGKFEGIIHNIVPRLVLRVFW